MAENPETRLDSLMTELEAGTVSRRQLIERLAYAGVSVSAAAALLARAGEPAFASTLGQAATPKRGGTLNFGWYEEISSLDPHKSPAYSSINFFHLLRSGGE